MHYTAFLLHFLNQHKMDYYKIVITICPFQEWLSDLLTAKLADSGYEGFTESEEGLEAYIPVEKYNEQLINDALAFFDQTFSFKIKKEFIKSQNWNEVWEKNYFKPLVIAEDCLIRAPFHKEYPKCRYEVIIEPNMAFGTGNHETTSMMIEAILKEELHGKNVLDMGCGTGILSILALMKGAKSATAIDIDETAVIRAKENALLNNTENLIVKKGDAAILGNEKFDIIFANIHKNVLVNDVETYTLTLAEEGIIFMSGFFREDMEDIKDASARAGLQLSEYMERNRWIMAKFQLKL
jgi:ribosomal protein L11 methyltransferase